MFRSLLALLAAGAFAAPVAAHEYEIGALVIGHPWARPTAPGMPMGAAYLSITNNGKAPDVLIEAHTPAAADVQIHQTSISEGMARMRPLNEIVIAPGATVRIEPGGIHLMLVDLKAPLELGKSVPLTLRFRVAGEVTVQLRVEARDTPSAAENVMSQTLGVVTVVARSINANESEDALKYFPSLNVRKRYIGDFDHAVLASRASGLSVRHGLAAGLDDPAHAEKRH